MSLDVHKWSVSLIPERNAIQPEWVGSDINHRQAVWITLLYVMYPDGNNENKNASHINKYMSIFQGVISPVNKADRDPSDPLTPDSLGAF